MPKLSYAHDISTWHVRAEGSVVKHPITSDQAIQIDEDQFLEVIAEAEVLDELSKSTLVNYISKASRDAAERGVKGGEAIERGNTKSFGKHVKKAELRVQNVSKAAQKLTKEDLENLDELSRNTLVRYTQSAVVAKGDHDRNWAISKISGDHEDAAKHEKKSGKRYTGILKATNKLRKEDVEEFNEGDIIDQLRKAADISTKAPVRFADGHASNIPTHAAQTALKKYEYKKDPNGKRALAMKMNNSLKDFKAVLDMAEEDEFEQLDEISDKLRGSYTRKAYANHSDHKDAVDFYNHHPSKEADDHKPHHEKMVARRTRGISLAHNSGAKAHEKHEASKTHKAVYDSEKGHYNIVHKATGKVVAHNVANSGGHALSHEARWNSKSVKEEFEMTEEETEIAEIMARVNAGEQLDEISAGKLGKYMRKAGDDRDKILDKPEHEYDEKRHTKRWHGIETAKKKLVGGPGSIKRPATNEEVENQVTEKVKFDDDEDDRAEKIAAKKAKRAGDLWKRTRAKEKRQFEEEQPIEERKYEDSEEAAEAKAKKNLKKTYDNMRRARANDKRKFEDTLYKVQLSDAGQALAESLYGSFADKLKNIVSANRSIDREFADSKKITTSK
jgi:hypothetical protein